MCARGEVSSSNKRKVALWILLLLPHADHLPPFLVSRLCTGPLPLFLQPPPLLLPSSASLPRNRAYLSLRSCKQSNSKLPAIVTHSATVTTEPGEALRIAEEENARRIGRGRGDEKKRNPFCVETLGAEALMCLIGSRSRVEKIHVEGGIRSKIQVVCRKRAADQTEEISKKLRERLGAQ